MSNYGCMGMCKLHGTPNKPDRCVAYPQIHDHLRSKCTYYFQNGKRQGTCQPNVCQEEICCAVPRDRGEPDGVHQDLLAGGLPCKHLEWHVVPEPPMEKEASDPGDSIYHKLKNLMYKTLSGDTDV